MTDEVSSHIIERKGKKFVIIDTIGLDHTLVGEEARTNSSILQEITQKIVLYPKNA